MKVVAATGRESLLVEMSVEELKRVTNWKNDSYYLALSDFRPGVQVDLVKEFNEAYSLLQSFRGIAPSLRQSAKRLENLALSVEVHEPDSSRLQADKP